MAYSAPHPPKQTPPSALESAILRTILYADVFDFPLTEIEIHHYLIGQKSAPDQVSEALRCSEWLQSHLAPPRSGYFALKGREPLYAIRAEREMITQRLHPVAARYGGWLRALPFVRMVALTGALAVRNPHDRLDDLDYFVITAPGRVWVARIGLVVMVRIARLWGVTLCPNYVLAETALTQSRRDLYIAHEIAQMIPIHQDGYYSRFRAENAWSDQFLPNATQPQTELAGESSPLVLRGIGRAIELLLRGGLGDYVEEWERERKLRKFAPKLASPEGQAQLDSQRVKGHFKDYGAPALTKYRAKLAEYGLSDVVSEG